MQVALRYATSSKVATGTSRLAGSANGSNIRGDILADSAILGKAQLVTRSLYRLPWRLGTSPTLAVKVSEGCGLGCCPEPSQFVPVEEVAAVLAQARHWPSADSIALVGGEPARHPHIIEIVRRAREFRGKVVVCSNGFHLNAVRLRELRNAGTWGINFRVNRNQDRPGWRDCTEAQLEGLRSHYAELVASVGGLLCAFEVEIPDGNARLLAETMAWAERHIDRVQRLVLHYEEPERPENPARPRDMAENWSPAGCLATDSGDVAATVAWRVGRRGGEILAASARLLRMLCEYYKRVHGRPFAYLNPQSLTSQITCWLAALSDMSLRPLANEIVAGLRSPSRFASPRLASQFLFSVEHEDHRRAPVCPGAAYDSLALPLAGLMSAASGTE